MELTEKQLEAIFEWIQKEAGTKIAIRFIKQFSSTPSQPEVGDPSLPLCKQYAGGLLIKDDGNVDIVKNNLSIETENRLKNYIGRKILSISIPGKQLTVSDIVSFGHTYYAIIEEATPERNTAIIYEKNFNGTGNDYWATIIN